MKATAPGGEAPDFTAKALGGEAISLHGLRGQYILIDFWGSWCGPCRMSAPELVKLYDDLKARGVNIEFLGITTNERSDESWIAAIEEDDLHWPHINDGHLPAEQSVQSLYAVTGVPTTLLIDPAGIIELRGHPMELIPQMRRKFGLPE